MFEVGPQLPNNCRLDYKMLKPHDTYAEELSSIKRRASPSHALGFWHLWLVTHSKTLCVFYLKIKLQFVTLDGLKFYSFFQILTHLSLI